MTLNSVCLVLLILPVIFGVGMDYLAPALRSQALNCKSLFNEVYCHVKCGDEKAICIKDQCLCLSAAVTKALKRQNDNEDELDDEIIDVVDSGETNQDQTRIENLPIYALRPTVRHHIAHFCPNLDIARECIKKCMTLGKPAFCGKDHVCYCGHKYSSTDNNSQVNIKDMYAQFNDLYTKYFGADSIEN